MATDLFSEFNNSDLTVRDCINLDAVFQVLPDLFFLMDDRGTILDYRAGDLSDLYIPAEQFLNKRMQDVLPKDVGCTFNRLSKICQDSQQVVTFEYQLPLFSGIQHFQARLSSLEGVNYVVAVIQNITARKNAEIQLRESENRIRDLINHSSATIFVKDLNGRYLSVNKAFTERMNLTNEQIVGKTNSELFPPDIADMLTVNDRKAIEADCAIEIEESVVIDGVQSVYLSIKYPVKDHLDNVYGVCGICSDISRRKQLENEMSHQAHFDALTNLPNRLLALDRLSQMIREAKRKNRCVGVIYLDLDGFKQVNDCFGHDVGDKLLVESAERLSSVVREEDTVSRIGGDEFIVLLRGLDSPDDARQVAEIIIKSFREAFVIDGNELLVTTSVGIAVYPNDGDDGPLLLRNADTAMYQAKQNGKNTYSFFTKALNEAVSRRLAIETELHKAEIISEFKVLFQPQVVVDSGKVIAAEALVRWHSPIFGELPPDEFINIAEQVGAMVDLGDFVLTEAINLLAQWYQQHGYYIRISVNLSARQFRDPHFVSRIKQLMSDAKVPSEYLELEITEAILLNGQHCVAETLSSLAEFGLVLTMDDFGTGYASLSFLQKFSFKLIKIDLSLVQKINNHDEERVLIKAMIAMAHALGMQVVAEGVETKEQFAILKELGCDFAQGYLFGPPVDKKQLSQF